MSASCDSEKGRRPGSGLPAAVREGGHRLHLPYLKRLPEDHLGRPAEAGDASCHSAKQLWCFEPLTRERAGPVGWGVPLRVRHVGSVRRRCHACHRRALPLLARRDGPIAVFFFFSF